MMRYGPGFLAHARRLEYRIYVGAKLIGVVLLAGKQQGAQGTPFYRNLYYTDTKIAAHERENLAHISSLPSSALLSIELHMYILFFNEKIFSSRIVVIIMNSICVYFRLCICRTAEE